MDHPDTHRLIDFSEPVAVLYLSVGHHLTDDDEIGGVRDAVRGIVDTHAVADSYLAFSQVVHDDPAAAARLSEQIGGAGIPWQTRTPAEVDALVDGLEPVAPGMVDLHDWRPDRFQPALDPAPEPLRPYEGIIGNRTGAYEYGGILRKA
ncbi:SAM-dependent methyltransferase [Saccharopolyspora griseoalba]|uniref:SAM-dependent methyltransferase n=1 Tax=Saccharopolyspora griseoalba TaxID=1431848 RepID=A0ABW2LFY4_9PSEU